MLGSRRFVLSALLLSGAYLAVQAAYITRLPLVMDEFDGAYEAHQLITRTPYRDFQPYKTVIGYYLQLPPLLVTESPWTGLMLSKAWLALINAGVLFAATLYIGRWFTPWAALGAQALLICATNFLTRSSEIRVDMLTAWAGLASFLLLLDRRWLMAGGLAGVSFLMSQKGIYYIVAANAAAGLFWLFESRDRRTFRDLVLLNAAIGVTVLAYIGLWSLAASPAQVISTTFFRHSDIAFGNLYNLRGYWITTLRQNPFFYGGALVGIIGLASARSRGLVTPTHTLVAVYGAAVFALCRWHRQPWPYFFVILLPSLMVVHAAFLDFVDRQRHWKPLATAVLLAGGVAFPLTYMADILPRRHDYQRHVIQLAHAMLEPGDTYLAGNDLVYDREQAHPALRRLGAVHIRAMNTWPDDRLDALTAEIEASRPKLIIFDYRITSLPVRVKSYLARRYDFTWSSVQGYAPLVGADERHFEIWFDGEYRVETQEAAIIDGHRRPHGATVWLHRGSHRNHTAAPVRLRLIPPSLPAYADPAMKKRRTLFSAVYNY